MTLRELCWTQVRIFVVAVVVVVVVCLFVCLFAFLSSKIG